MSDIISQLRNYSYHKQLLGKQGNNLKEILDSTIGVYSPHPSTALSLLARSRSFREDDFHKLDTEKIGIRLPSMRGSVYMLPHEEAFKIMAANLPPSDDPCWEKRYSQKGREISPEFYDDWKGSLITLLTQPMTVSELKKVTEVPADKLKFVLNRMCLERALVRVGAKSLRSNIISYVATQSWTKINPNSFRKEESLKWLASRYLEAFGPARLKDFQWWTGVTMTEAKAAFSGMEVTNLEGDLLILTKDVKDFNLSREIKKNNIDILPQWDCYTMGYAPDGRERFVSKENQHHIYGKLGATLGNGIGTVLVNGLAHASWTSRFKGSTMNITLNLFEKVPAPIKKIIMNEFHEVAKILKAKKVDIDI